MVVAGMVLVAAIVVGAGIVVVVVVVVVGSGGVVVVVVGRCVLAVVGVASNRGAVVLAPLSRWVPLEHDATSAAMRTGPRMRSRMVVDRIGDGRAAGGRWTCARLGAMIDGH